MVRICAVHVHLAAVLQELGLAHDNHIAAPGCQRLFELFACLQLPLGRSSLCIEPDEDAAQDLSRLVCSRLGTLTNLFGKPAGIRNALALAVSIKVPAVEGTADAVAHDLPASSEVGAHVRAEGIEHGNLAILSAKGHELAAQRADGLHLPIGHISRVANGVPGVGKARGEVLVSQGSELARRVVEVVLVSPLPRNRPQLVGCKQAQRSHSATASTALTELSEHLPRSLCSFTRRRHLDRIRVSARRYCTWQEL
mmetsp:Transcript_60448/g.141378  ORF Transcript_60448/g.141378 Transcript_60448/m.141378 type:complete len:254 (-) Transcript_60448:68-829(-)